MTEIKRSPYAHLLEDKDFKRWFDNVRRGSVTYAFEMVRRLGYIEKRFGKSPKQLAKMTQRQATNFLLDMVSSLEGEKRSGSYISNCVKPVKSWLDFNGITIQQRIKISGRDELTKFADERTPTPDELRRILNTADLRAKAACSLVAFSGLRLEVLGDYLGDDGLKIHDLPELVLKGKEAEFQSTPTTVNIRKNLSKTGNQFFTFLSAEGCEYLKQYLEFRVLSGEKLSPDSPIITPTKSILAGQHIRTTNIGDMMRKPIRAAGFDWRPYVLRRYFDTRMMLAESDGLIIRDYRSFWMGHKGDIEHTYTVNKRLSKDVVEKMRESYAKASTKYLDTAGRKESFTKEDMVSEFNKQFLRLSGYADAEIEKFGDLSQVSSEQLQEMIRKKSMEMLGLTNNHQKIVPLLELRNYILNGWEYVRELPNNEAIVRLPGHQFGS